MTRYRPLLVASLCLMMIACAGDDADTAVFDQSAASDEQCEFGGTVITSGYDTNDDGVLDAIFEETVICHGAPGDTGDDGASSLIETEELPAGDECSEGGVRIDVGLDESGDGQLQESEITDSHIVCNLDCHSGDPLEVELDTDDLPSPIDSGSTVEVPITTDAQSLQIQAIDPAGVFDFHITFDPDEEHLVVEHLIGLGIADLALQITDGCDMGITPLRLGPFEN